MMPIDVLIFARECLLWWTALAVAPIEYVYDTIEDEIERRGA